MLGPLTRNVTFSILEVQKISLNRKVGERSFLSRLFYITHTFLSFSHTPNYSGASRDSFVFTEYHKIKV